MGSKHHRVRLQPERAELGEPCASGCRDRSSGEPRRCRPGRAVCDRCRRSIEDLLTDMPELWVRLSAVVARGSLPGEPSEGGRSRSSHAPMPIRTEVVALLDRAGDESVTLLLYRWALWVREQQGLSGAPRADLSAGGFLLRHLDWLAGQPQAARLLKELRSTARRMRFALGERPAAAVGICGAEVEGGQCGGPLLPIRTTVAVRCAWCKDEWLEGDLRGLGRLLTKRWVSVSLAAYLAGRPEASVRDWQQTGQLASLCEIGSRQILVDALALAPLAESKRSRRRRSA